MSGLQAISQRLEDAYKRLRNFATWLDQSSRNHLIVFMATWVLSMLMGLPLLILMLAGFYSFEAIGMSKPRRWLHQLGLGLIVGIGDYAFRALVLFPFALWISSLIGGEFAISPSGMVEGNARAYLFHISMAIVNAGFFEEFLFRGYLLNRTIEYLGKVRYRWALAMLSVAVLFGLLHFHMGATGVIFAFIWFITSCIIFLALKRNLWPMMVSHAFSDCATWTLAFVGWLPAFHSAVLNFYGLN